ncbi:MAG: hypothetical protein OXJ64_05910 [Boseongicola sp.]|nr:hypothetical protein [Boseongicola sp.]
MKYRVLICDDEFEQTEAWVEGVKSIAPAETYSVLAAPSTEDIGVAVKELLVRRGAAREGVAREAEICLFDSVDIVVVDYDLVHIEEDGAQHTGEGIARLARTFAGCSVVVVLNQFEGIDFDLSLRGHLESHADLNIDGDRLTTPGLWRSPPWEGFRPWYWQTLDGAVETQRARERLVAEFFDRPIVEALGMRLEDASRLSDSAFGFIAPNAEDFAALQGQTFRAFLSTAQDGRDAEALSNSDRAGAARFVAARIGKWLERELLGPQDVLLDVPHLLQRFPFLMGDRIEDPDAWNEAVHEVGWLRETLGEDVWFGASECLSRPAVWFQRIEEDGAIGERRATFDFSVVPELVFLEDRSVFAPMSEAKEFRAGFHNSYDRRFVRPVQEIRYGPQRRFAFG